MTPGSAPVPKPENKFEVTDLEFHYGDFHALTGITVGIKRHAVTAFIGPSGCGKSTFLRCLNRMNDLIPGARAEGSVLLDGEDVYGPGVDPVDLRRRVGMIFQQPNPFPMSVYENVAYGPRLHGVRDRKKLDEIVEQALTRANVWKETKTILGRNGLSLSGGQQQRLCIARVLAVQPEVLLMDEPCSAIDPTSVQKIEDLMAEIKDTVTIVIVTHNMQQAARVSDYTAMMMMRPDRAGEMIEFDNTKQIFTLPKDKRTEDYVTGRFG